MMRIQKGDRITVRNNSIMKLMGYDVVEGIVFLVTAKAIHLKCSTTGSMELISMGDGDVSAGVF